MADSERALQLVTELVEQLHHIPTSNVAGIFGTTSNSRFSQELQHEAAQLLHGMKSGWQASAATAQLNKLEGLLQTAMVMQILSQKDLQGYLGTIDDIYALLDQEN